MRLIRLLALLTLLVGTATHAAPNPKSDEFWFGAAADGTPTVRLYYFYSPTCPHCQAAAPFIDELRARWPWLEVQKYSVKDDRANAKFYYETALALGTKALSVPGFVFCRQVLIGYDTAETTGAEIAAALETCHQRRLDAGIVSMTPTPGAAGAAGAAGDDAAHTPLGAEQGGTTVRIPFVGTIDASALSLPVLTLVLAGMDAFNPCAFFVLLFLLSLLVHARSRARMAVVGGTFVLFSGLVYFVFMAAWLNVFLIAGELRVITIVAGLVALLVAALNI